MAQYQNEYEGIGNALMGIGGMYYTASEKRKEEERKRKELEDERKYQEARADLEWQRKAPLETLTQELRRIQIENAKLSGQKTLVDTYLPRVDKLGTIARTTVPSFEGGQLTYESTDEPIQIPPRVERSPYERVGNDLIDTRNMQVAYRGENKAAAAATKDPNVLPISARAKMESDILAAQNVLDASSDSDLISKRTTRAAEQAKINAQRSVLDKYSPKAPASSGGSLMSGLFDAIKTGVMHAPLGRNAESAAGAAFEGAVADQVAANTIAAQTGKPAVVRGTTSTSLIESENTPENSAELKKENAKTVAPFSDMVNAFIKKQGREPTATERVALRKKYDAWLAANKE